MSSESKQMANEVFDGTVAFAWRDYWAAVNQARKVHQQAVEHADMLYRRAEQAAREARIHAVQAALGLYDKARDRE